jgi:exodeoxyribonuclease-5
MLTPEEVVLIKAQAQAKRLMAEKPVEVKKSEPEKLPPPAPKVNVYKFELTEAQTKAVEVAKKLADGDRSVGVLTGFAGTGKTTVIRSIAHYLGDILVLAPTGKAAQRVMEATGLNARTIHRWMYIPHEDEKGNVTFEPKPEDKLIRPMSGLIVIDEASMVGRELWEDLVDTARMLDCSILCVGDPFQLPPVEVEEKKAFSILDPSFPADYRIHLTEIIRQALDSPIIRGSMMVREGRVSEALKNFTSYSSKAMPEAADWFNANDGVVLCHSNAQRHSINRAVRERRKLDEVQRGEPLLVLRNNYDLDIYNGEVRPFDGWTRRVEGTVPVSDYHKVLSRDMHYSLGLLGLGQAVFVEEGIKGDLGGLTYRDLRYQLKKAKKLLEIPNSVPIPLVEANFGYALTCHKAQGSEWKNVLVHIGRSLRLSTEEGHRWLYTALTRAKESTCIIVD